MSCRVPRCVAIAAGTVLRFVVAVMVCVILVGLLGACTVEPVDSPDVSATPTRTPTRTPTPVAAATTSPTATPEPSFKIAKTDGDGVAVRDACDDGARVSAPGEGIREETVVELIGAGEGDCAEWMHVRAPDGRASWVRSRYLETANGAPDGQSSDSSRITTATPLPTSTWTPPPNARPNYSGDIEDCFSILDGNLDALEDLVRPLLNDESSMRTHSTRFITTPDEDDYHLVRMDYSAENAFGGRVKAIAYGKVRIENGHCRTILTDPGF